MYKPIDKLQHSFLDFNQPMGLHITRITWKQLGIFYFEFIPWDSVSQSDPAVIRKKLRLMQVHWFFSVNAFQQIC